MEIRLTKGRGKPDTLVCTRPDGSSTWTRLHPVFAMHDLTHYAVETTLGLREGFFGLVAAGWDITVFERPKSERPELPLEALQAEYLVSLFQAEQADGGYADFIGVARETLATNGVPFPPPLTPDALADIRSRMHALLGRWAMLPPGEALTLAWTTPGAADATSAAPRRRRGG